MNEINKQNNYLITLTALILLISAFSFNAFAQSGGTISGLIMINDQPLAGAKVTLQAKNGASQTTLSDTTGKYNFENVSAGEYLITAESNASISRTVTIEKNQSLTIDLDIKLDSRRISGVISEIVTISTGTPKPIDQVSKSVSIISGQEIESRQELTVVDALRTVPGLRVQQLGGFGRFASIKARGLRNQDTAVLLDGQRIRDASAITGESGAFLSDLTVTNIEKVEVLRGSGSSLYGTNAIGGVFNIKTDSGGGKFRANLLSEGGGLGFFRGRANFAGGAFADQARFSFGASHTDFTKGVDGDDAARNTGLQGRIAVQLPKDSVLSFRGFFSDAFVQLNSGADTIGTLPANGIINAVPLSRAELRRYETGTSRNQLNFGNATFIPDANDPDARQASRLLSGQINFSQAINSDVSYSLSYQNLTTKRRNRNGTGGIGFQTANGNVFDGTIQTFNARADFRLGEHNLVTAGYEFEREKYGNDNFNALNILSNKTNATQRSNTFFLQDQLNFDQQRLQISGAFRGQFFTLGTPNFTGAAPIYQNLTLKNPAAAYTADGSFAYFFRNPGTKIRAHLGNGYRVPSLYERYGTFFSSFGTPGFVALGDPNLKPERTIAVDGGIDQSFANSRAKFSATYFYTKLQKTIGFANSATAIGITPRPSGGYFNTSGGIARGAELSTEFSPFSFTGVFASYTYTNSDQSIPQVAGSGILTTLGIPEQQFSLIINQQIARKLYVNFDFVASNSYLGNIFSNESFTTRIYRFQGLRKGDLTASYEIPTGSDKVRVKIFGKIENIFNQDYYENGFRTARAFGRGGVELSF